MGLNAEENLGFPDIHQVAVSPLHEAAPHFHQVKASAQRAVTGAQFQSEMQGAYRDLVKVWEKMNAKRFDKIMLKTKTVGAQATPEGIQVQFEGLDGTKSEGTYDLVLQAVGRTPNGKKSPLTKPVWQSPIAASSTWTFKCASTYRTRRCTKGMWRPR